MIKSLLVAASLLFTTASYACDNKNQEYDVEFDFQTKEKSGLSFSTDILCKNNKYYQLPILLKKDGVDLDADIGKFVVQNIKARQDFVAVIFKVTDTGVEYSGSGVSFDKKNGCDPKLGKSIAKFAQNINMGQDVVVIKHDICGIPLKVTISPKLDTF